MSDVSTSNGQCLVGVTLDENSLGRGSPDQEHERAVAIYDLIERNQAISNGSTSIRDGIQGVTPDNTLNTFRENVANFLLRVNGGAILVDNICIGPATNPAGNTIGSPDHLNLGC